MIIVYRCLKKCLKLIEISCSIIKLIEISSSIRDMIIKFDNVSNIAISVAYKSGSPTIYPK